VTRAANYRACRPRRRICDCATARAIPVPRSPRRLKTGRCWLWTSRSERGRCPEHESGLHSRLSDNASTDVPWQHDRLLAVRFVLQHSGSLCHVRSYLWLLPRCFGVRARADRSHRLLRFRVFAGCGPVGRPPRSQRHRRKTKAEAEAAAAGDTHLEAKSDAFDQSRSNLYTTVGTTSNTVTHQQIEALPQGSNTTVEKVILQA